MEEALVRSITNKSMAYPSLFTDNDNNGVNRAWLEYERVLEEANGRIRAREAAGSSGSGALGRVGQLSPLVDQPRGYSKIAEERKRRKELATMARADRLAHGDDHQGDMG